jgi:hypothetical protein
MLLTFCFETAQPLRAFAATRASGRSLEPALSTQAGLSSGFVTCEPCNGSIHVRSNHHQYRADRSDDDATLHRIIEASASRESFSPHHWSCREEVVLSVAVNRVASNHA